MRKVMIVENERRFSGEWIESSFHEASQGKIKQKMIHMIKDMNEGLTFWGISIHHKSDGFKYFIGTLDTQGQVILPAGNYLKVDDFLDAYQTYQELHRYSSQTYTLFDASFQFDDLPVKIEQYVILDGDIQCITIELPMMTSED